MESGAAGRSQGGIAGTGPALALASLLCACGHLPSGSPTATEFEQPGPSTQPPYVLLPLDGAAAEAIARERPQGLDDLAELAGYRPSLALRPGDTVSVTVFEVSPVSLLGSSAPAAAAPDPRSALPIGGHMATIPPQLVDLDGTITIPFAGPVKVAGLTPKQAAARIARSLAGKATDPQVVLTLDSTLLDTTTVGGEVVRPGLVPLTVRSERVLDVVAQAGGTKYSSFDSDVQLVRDGRVVRVNLQHLIDDPAGNITVRPGDGVFLVHNPRSFTVLGSALRVSQYDFNTEHVSLAEALGRAGGARDDIANVGQVYLLRLEGHAVVEGLLAAGDPRRAVIEGSLQPVPVAYRLDLRRAGGYFISQAVQMRDKDVVLVTNADATQLAKLLAIVRGITGIYYDLKRFSPY